MSDEPPQEPPPPQPPPPAAAPPPTAADAAQARDAVEEAARALFIAALLWYTLHGDNEPDDDSTVLRAARRVANLLLRSLRRWSATPPPVPVGQERDRWVDDVAGRISREAINLAAAHHPTVSRRVRRDTPDATEAVVDAAFADDSVWAKAAARTAATKYASEALLQAQADVERITGEKHSTLWISRGDPKVRSLHRQLHGRVRPYGDPYHTWPTGQELRYPGDQSAPIDAWINCRCALMLVPARLSDMAEEVFSVPNLPDFDVPLAASAHAVASDVMRAELELRGELAWLIIAASG